MVIDLVRCVGCGSCMMACKAEHFLPPGISWARVLRREYGEFPNVHEVVAPILCNHCKDAACVKVCPSGATVKQECGIVTVDDEKCVGCRYCMMACPYGARSYHERFQAYYPGKQPTAPERLSRQAVPTGVVTKCTFCYERVEKGLAAGLKPGVDRAATPACVNACMTGARYFGDLDDPESEVSRLIRARKGSQLHEEYGTDPSIYYLR